MRSRGYGVYSKYIRRVYNAEVSASLSGNVFEFQAEEAAVSPSGSLAPRKHLASEGEGMRVTSSKSSKASGSSGGKHVNFDNAFLIRSPSSANTAASGDGGASGSIYAWLTPDEFM